VRKRKEKMRIISRNYINCFRFLAIFRNKCSPPTIQEFFFLNQNKKVSYSFLFFLNSSTVIKEKLGIKKTQEEEK